MRTGRGSVPLWGLAGASLLLCSPSAAQDRCSEMVVAGVRPGMTAGEVHALHGKGATNPIVLPGGVRAGTEDYTLPGGMLHVEYDGPADRAASRVTLARQPLRLTYETMASLVRRLGQPASGRDALVEGLRSEPAIWIEARCDTVLTYYRRAETWFAEEVHTFVRVESLSGLPSESPASDAVKAYLASGSPPSPPDELPTDGAVADESSVTAASAYDAPPRRTEYVRPAYPPGAKQLGVKGVVTVHVSVHRNGTVSDARIVHAEPQGYGFEEAVLEAAKRWSFIPASRGGVPVDAEVDIVVRFR
jgi:TonB family protein